MNNNTLRAAALWLILSLIPLQPLFGQTLKNKMKNLFGGILEIQLAGPGEHGDHFKPANVLSSNTTINSFNNFIAANIASFPLSSTAAGLTFDFSTGKPVSTTTSLGPIFAERAQTLGQGRFNLGFNYSFLNLAKIRGLNLEDLQFTFTHADVGAPGLGDSDNEFDTLDFAPHLDLDAFILAFFFTFGITNDFDISVAVPFVNVSMKANPFAQINSFTFATNDTANHNFGGSPADPILTLQPQAINDDATGIGDIAVRAKYHFLKGKDVDLAMLLEFRPATGNEDNFLGTGKSTIRAAFISSSILGDFAPHLNLAFERHFSDLDRDEIQITAGYDQKLAEGLTLAIDFLGEFQVGSEIDALKFPESATIQRTVGNTSLQQQVSLTNMPQFSNDNVVNAAFGVKVNPRKELLFVANVFVPLNEGGLRSDFIPTVGFEFSF
ncbi:MAG: hypothetical protein ACE5HO_20120 [bacterium]